MTERYLLLKLATGETSDDSEARGVVSSPIRSGATTHFLGANFGSTKRSPRSYAGVLTDVPLKCAFIQLIRWSCSPVDARRAVEALQSNERWKLSSPSYSLHVDNMDTISPLGDGFARNIRAVIQILSLKSLSFPALVAISLDSLATS